MPEIEAVADKPKKERIFTKRMGPEPMPDELKVRKFSMSLAPEDYDYVVKIKKGRKLFRLSKALTAIIKEHREANNLKK